MDTDYAIPVSTNLPFDPNTLELSASFEPLEIIAQPCLTSRLRYRSDFDTNRNRRGVLRSQNNPNYRSPAIRIPQAYLDVAQQYYIRVCLVTIVHEQTNCRYIHPYDLEDIDVDEHNDRANNAVLFPIESDDKDGIKSFPNLRIVKKKADALKDYGDLRAFDSPNLPSAPQLSTPKDTIKEFNLDRPQLAFTLGRKTDGNLCVFYTCTTQFSDEIEITGRGSDSDRSHIPKPSICQMYKYAPRNGYTDGNDEVLMFFTNKLKQNRYGDLEVTFEYDTSDHHWSAPVLDLEVNDQMISFRTPTFPFQIDSRTTVNVILKQRKRTFEPLQFDYISIVGCPQCQRNAMINPNPNPNRNPNKRSISQVDDEQTDIPINVSENNPEPEASGFSGMLNPEWFEN